MLFFSFSDNKIGWRDCGSHPLLAQRHNPLHKGIHTNRDAHTQSKSSRGRARGEVTVIIRLCGEVSGWMDPVTGSYTIPPPQFSQSRLLGMTVKKPHYHIARLSTDGGLWDPHALVTVISSPLMVKQENEQCGRLDRWMQESKQLHSHDCIEPWDFFFFFSISHLGFLKVACGISGRRVLSNNLDATWITVTMAAKKQRLKLTREAIKRIRVKPWDFNTNYCFHGSYLSLRQAGTHKGGGKHVSYSPLWAYFISMFMLCVCLCFPEMHT